MPHWYCPRCRKLFTSTHHFNIHLNGQRNTKCRTFFENNPADWPNGVYDARIGARVTIPGPQPRTGSILLDQSAPPVPQGVPPAAPEVPIPLPNEEDADSMVPPMDAEFSDLDEFFPDFGNNEACVEVVLPQTEPISTLNGEFDAYLAKAQKDFVSLPPHITAAIDLCEILEAAGADLVLYDRVMEWHVANLNAAKKVPYKQLIKQMQDRHNMKGLIPKSVPATLPACGTKVNIPCIDFLAAKVDPYAHGSPN